MLHVLSVLKAFLPDALASNFPVWNTGALALEPPLSYQNSPSSCRSVSLALTSGSTVFQLGQLESKATGEALGMGVCDNDHFFSWSPKAEVRSTLTLSTEGLGHQKKGVIFLGPRPH